MADWERFSTFAPTFWCRTPERGVMKREPGENPGQTRCCDSCHNSLMKQSHWSLSGKAVDEGISQKTCRNV